MDEIAYVEQLFSPKPFFHFGDQCCDLEFQYSVQAWSSQHRLLLVLYGNGGQCVGRTVRLGECFRLLRFACLLHEF
jgi:hypothetical protein